MHFLVAVCFCVDYGKKYTFTGGWGGWEEKWGLKLTSAEVEVEVEAGLGNMEIVWRFVKLGRGCPLSIQTYFLLNSFFA